MLSQNENYDILKEASEVVENRLQEREEFVKATTYQIARAWIEDQVDEEQTQHVIEEVGNKYPLSLEEMAQMIGKIYEAKSVGSIEPPDKKELADTKTWRELLARMNPTYKIYRDEDGDISLGLVQK